MDHQLDIWRHVSSWALSKLIHFEVWANVVNLSWKHKCFNSSQEKRYKRVHNRQEFRLNLFFRLLAFFIFPSNCDYLHQSPLSLPPEQLIIQQFVMVGRLFQNWGWPHCARSRSHRAITVLHCAITDTSRDKWVTSRDNSDTSRDNCIASREPMQDICCHIARWPLCFAR